MLYETGQVVAVEADGLWVETLKQSACAKCSAKAGCGQKLLASVHPKHNMTFVKAVFFDGSEAKSWSVGDQAILGVAKEALVKAALIAYLVPLLMMLLGIWALPEFVGSISFLSSEMLSLIGAVLGLIIGGLIVRWHSRSASGKDCYQAKVVSKALKVENI